MRTASLAVTCALAACATGHSVESRAVLDRPPATETAEVKHILIGYSWLASKYRQLGMTLDPRAESRNQTAAEALAAEILAKLQAGAPIEPLMAEYSEDGGSAKSGQSYTATPDSRLVDPFKQLSLRLQPGESGIVRSEFGYHVIKRIK